MPPVTLHSVNPPQTRALFAPRLEQLIPSNIKPTTVRNAASFSGANKDVGTTGRVLRREVCMHADSSSTTSIVTPEEMPFSTNHPTFRNFSWVVSDRKSDQDEKDACAMEMMERIDELDSFKIANIFHFCKKGAYVNAMLLGALADRVLSDPDIWTRFDGIQIAMTVNSIAMLSRQNKRHLWVSEQEMFNNQREFLRILLVTAVENDKLQQWSRQSCANVMHGMGTLFGVNDDEEMDVEIGAVANALMKEICKDARMNYFKPQELSNVLLGCAHLGYGNPHFLWRTCEEITIRLHEAGEGHFTTQNLSNIMWALGKLVFFDVDVLLALVQSMSGRMHLFTTQGVAMVSHGLASFKRKGHLGGDGKFLLVEIQPLLNEIAREACAYKRVQEMNAQNASLICRGLAEFGHLDKRLMDNMSRRVVELAQLGQNVRRDSILRMLHACGLVGYDGCFEFLRYVRWWLDSADIEFVTIQEVTTTMWSLFRIERLNVQHFEMLCGKLIELRERGQEPVIAEWLHLWESWMYMRVSGRITNLKTPAMRDLIEEAKNAF